ncbi:3-hydroxybutyrate dehydrogenase [Bradyrhizobium japonicum]
MGSLSGKNAVVTGSTSGIGLAYARAFAAAGANVVINGFGSPEDIEKERAKIESDFGVKAVYSPADMTKPAEIAGMIALGEKSFGSVDVLVNNAGIQFVSPIEEFPVEKWDQIIAINLSSAFHAIRAAVPGMKKKGWGRIINTASAHSLVASPFKSAYVSAKHGIAGLTKTVALEVATHKITCNCISPGYVWTPLVERADPRHDEGAQPHARAGHQRRAARRAADQGVRHLRAGRSARAVPVRRRCRADHRHQPVDRRRLDGGVTTGVMPGLTGASSTPRRKLQERVRQR